MHLTSGAMSIAETPADGRRRTATFSELFTAIVDNVSAVVQGKRDVIELVVTGLVAEGHVLIEDVPGVGKTSLAKALAASIGGSAGRVQFTPDLLPSDVIGVTIWNRDLGSFEFRRGPIFANLLLGDEINRASPKTQSALLEAMEERQVTVDGTSHPLARPFMVLATQNPIDHEGTYPLPESQLDRFLLRVSMGYPDRASELSMLAVHGEVTPLDRLTPVVGTAEVAAMVEAARRVKVAEPITAYLVDLAEASRGHRALTLGMSPRATLALQRVARARAASQGRGFVVPDDVKAVAPAVLTHRMRLSSESHLRGVSGDDVVTELLRTVPAPTLRT